jgi:hypothetical protein
MLRDLLFTLADFFLLMQFINVVIQLIDVIILTGFFIQIQ